MAFGVAFYLFVPKVAAELAELFASGAGVHNRSSLLGVPTQVPQYLRSIGIA
jgi:hypothetical protein